MKKEDILGTIAYLLILALGIVFIFTFIRTHATASGMGNWYILFSIGALFAGVVINAILYELAHVIGAKIGRYEIVSVAILRFTFVKDNGKWRFCFRKYNGLTGETRIVPKADAKKEPNPYPHLLFGTLFCAIEAIVVVVFFSIYKNDVDLVKSNMVYFFLTVAAVGLLILIYNILPFQVDCKTDGFNLTLVSNPKNRAAFNELLKVKHEMESGKDVEIETFSVITNFTADLNLNKVYSYLDENKYNEAEQIIDSIIAAKQDLRYLVYIRAKAQKVYIKLRTLDLEKANEFYEKEVPVSERRDLSEDLSMPSIRAYILMEGLLDKSRSECVRALNKVKIAYKRVPSQRKKIEASLFNASLKMVCEAHPKWELDSYYLPEEKAN